MLYVVLNTISVCKIARMDFFRVWSLMNTTTAKQPTVSGCVEGVWRFLLEEGDIFSNRTQAKFSVSLTGEHF
jgi:hypothetical protein